MKNMIRLLSFVSVTLILGAVPGWAQSFSVADFMPPAQAASPSDEAALRQVNNEAAVTTGTGAISGQPAVTAASAQDAINAYLAQRSAGFTELQFPSGFGFAATGVSSYAKHNSVVAARLDQRNAYNRAYTQAKKNLTQGLYGLSSEGQNKIAESMDNIDQASQGTLTRAETLTTEKIRQRLDGLLRGYVVYDVYDDFENTAVYVTIVTTPKTQGHFERPDSNALTAASVQTGLEQVVAEAKKGLVPPVGGRTVLVPATGELAFVGFGSSVVRQDKDKALQAKQNLNAEKIAQMRAIDALVGIITGDVITGKDSLDAQTKDLIADFEKTAADDPLAKPAPGSQGYKTLAERKKEFLSLESNSSLVASLRKGQLPPGVKSQGWRDPENAFAYTLAVYLPSASGRADQARESMNKGQIVTKPASGDPAGAATALPEGKLTQGPSGRVQSDDAL
jgi:hypothetical protein